MVQSSHIPGISGLRIVPVMGEILKKSSRTSLIITSSYSKAKEISDNLPYFTDAEIHLLPEEESYIFQYDARSREYMEERLSSVYALEKDHPVALITPVTGAIKKMAPKKEIYKHRIRLFEKLHIDIEDIKKKLVHMGFERVGLTEEKGQFSSRGEIIDVFPVNCKYPIRIDIFDTEIESIKSFDPISQRSVAKKNEITIFPAVSVILDEKKESKAINRINEAYDNNHYKLGKSESMQLIEKKDQLLDSIRSRNNYGLIEDNISYVYENTETIIDYLPKNAVIFVDDSDRLKETLKLREDELHNDFEYLIKNGHALSQDIMNIPGVSEYEKLFDSRDAYYFTSFTNEPRLPIKMDRTLHYDIKTTPHFGGHMDMFANEMARYLKNGYTVEIVCSTEDRKINLMEYIDERGIKGSIDFVIGNLSTGFVNQKNKKVIFRDGDIFKTYKKKRTKSVDENARAISSFSDIRVGDYVVHEAHGIGKYVGIEQLIASGNKKDYFKVKYTGADILYVPVEQMNLIQKFIGGGNKPPKINRLSGNEWKKTKSKAKKDIAEMSKDLLTLSAQRKSLPGYSFPPDTVWQKEFEDQFSYKETDDQLRSAESIKRDMEKPYPMDRLLCGDVGYGKTEVAARSIFKCAVEGKQAAVLVPTTILANQHYHTFMERFKEFPFVIEMLSRFRSRNEQIEIVKKIKSGGIDIIISTHRLLSEDVSFKDLGLLVVDEEQRFGVKHKEIIKKLRKNVDVLTLSATPIPRTLHMSLVGIRDMDVIEEPPEDRYPVQTYVMEESDDIIRETIRRELDRQGQVYIVYNRVRGIESEAQKIRETVPEAIVNVGHGQMKEDQLEKVMMDFIDGRFNVLIATTIIESGIDIGNVNTIIIMDADKFGLSQLYQLRGRVGRTNRVAFAYLLYKRNKILSEVAEERLSAIKEFTEFGAGFKLAMRDLEIRGAGNLLGTQQSGHMMAIGYELYSKMVEDAVKALNGEISSTESREEVQIELPISAYIPDKYIDDEQLKLQVYRDIAAIDGEDTYDKVKEDLSDRFGTVPGETVNLMKISLLKSYAEKIGITKIRTLDNHIIMELDKKKNIVLPVEEATKATGKNLSVRGKASPYILYKEGKSYKIDALLELTHFFYQYDYS